MLDNKRNIAISKDGQKLHSLVCKIHNRTHTNNSLLVLCGIAGVPWVNGNDISVSKTCLTSVTFTTLLMCARVCVCLGVCLGVCSNISVKDKLLGALMFAWITKNSQVRTWDVRCQHQKSFKATGDH